MSSRNADSDAESLATNDSDVVAFVVKSFNRQKTDASKPQREGRFAREGNARAKANLASLFGREQANDEATAPDDDSQSTSTLVSCDSSGISDVLSSPDSSLSLSPPTPVRPPAVGQPVAQSALTKTLGGGITLVRNSKTGNPLLTAQIAIATPVSRHSAPMPDINKALSDSDRAYANSAAAGWLKIQSTLGSSNSIEARITEPVPAEDGTVTQETRTYVFFPRSDPTPSTTKSPQWLNALNVLERIGEPHSGATSAGAAAFRKTARIVTIKRPMHICTDAARPDGRFLPAVSDAPFPPLDNDGIRSVVSLKILSAEATATLRAKIVNPSQADCAALIADAFTDRVAFPTAAGVNTANAARLKKDVWEQHMRTDVDVTRVVENLGASEGTIRRDLPQHLHRHFRTLCASVFSKYSPALTREDRFDAVCTLIAIPKMHLRTLHGSHSTHIRESHLAAQLAGNVCKQLGEREPPPPPRVIDPADIVALQEVDAKNIAKVIALACDGHLSDANKLLKRSGNPNPAPRQSTDEIVKNLESLHPKGSPPVGIKLPATPLYSTANVPIEALRQTVKRKCNASSPGPSGWTPELLHVALEDAAFAEAFRYLIVDICNGALDPALDKFLSASNIIGIPKDSGGTRPIAMGETFMKVAVDVALQRCADQLRVALRGTQLGVNCAGGAEYIAHTIRAFARDGSKPKTATPAGPGRVLITLDAKNAFNMPMREAMHQAIINSDMPGMLGVFKTGYAQHGTMFVVGTNGERIIESQRGARQGTVDGSAVFSLVLQPALNDIEDNHRGTFALAYLDDSTIAGDSIVDAANAVSCYSCHLNSHGAELQPKKCEIFMPGLVSTGPPEEYRDRVRNALNDAGLPADSPVRSFRIADTIKLLGASIAISHGDEAAHLYERLKKDFDNHIDQISKLPASPQALAFIRLCLLPSLSYHLRVHHPDVTAQLTRHCDARVEHLVQSWAQSHPFSTKQQAILRAPRNKGGANMPSLAAIAPAAYVSSLVAANNPRGKEGLPSQGHIDKACQEGFAKQLHQFDSSIPEHLDRVAQSGGPLGASLTTRVSEDVMGAYLRLTLASPSVAANADGCYYTCPGCSSIAVGRKAANLQSAAARAGLEAKKYTAHQFAYHAVGCAAMPGGAVTKRHNDIRNLLCKFVKAAGYSGVELEPRKLRQYDCGCGLTALSHDAYVAHKKVCSKALQAPRTHGPDLLFTDHSGLTIAIDVRVCNELCESHRGKPIAAIFAEAESEKSKKYGAICAAAGVTLLTFAVSALGALSTTTQSLLKSIAVNAPDMDYHTLCNSVAARAAVGSAQALLTAEGHVGIRPAARTISQAVIKILETSLKIPLTSAFLRGGDPSEKRLGVATPTPHELAEIMNRFETFLKLFKDDVNSIVRKAEAIKAEETAEATRLALERDPLHGAGPQHIERLPSVGAARARSAAPLRPSAPPPDPAQFLRDGAAASEEAHYYHVENTKREIELKTAEVLAAAARQEASLQNTAAAEKEEIRTLNAIAESTIARTMQRTAAAERRMESLEAVAKMHSVAAEGILATATRLESQARDTESLVIEKRSATKEVAIARISAMSAGVENAAFLALATNGVKQSAAELIGAKHALDATVTRNERSLQRALSQSHSQPSTPSFQLGPTIDTATVLAPSHQHPQQQHRQQQHTSSMRSAPHQKNSLCGRIQHESATTTRLSSGTPTRAISFAPSVAPAIRSNSVIMAPPPATPLARSSTVSASSNDNGQSPALSIHGGSPPPLVSSSPEPDAPGPRRNNSRPAHTSQARAGSSRS